MQLIHTDEDARVYARQSSALKRRARQPTMCEYAPVQEDQRHARQVIEDAMKQTGWSSTELARKAGVAPSTLNRFMNENDPKHIPSTRTLTKVAQVAGVEQAAAALPGYRAVSASKLESLPSTMSMPRDVPVMGTAMGATDDGAFWLNQGDPVDFVRRGPGIAHNRGAFSIYVEGDSMTPRFAPGELIYLDPARPVRVGDDVVLVVMAEAPGDAPRSYLKRLKRRTADRVIVEQFNPASDREFSARATRQMIRVLTLSEILGL